MALDQEIAKIKNRNRKVELDKAWETSWLRRLVVVFFTYVVATLWLFIIENPNPFLNAFIPTVGYILSTLTLPLLKKYWISLQEHED